MSEYPAATQHTPHWSHCFLPNACLLAPLSADSVTCCQVTWTCISDFLFPQRELWDLYSYCWYSSSDLVYSLRLSRLQSFLYSNDYAALFKMFKSFTTVLKTNLKFLSVVSYRFPYSRTLFYFSNPNFITPLPSLIFPCLECCHCTHILQNITAQQLRKMCKSPCVLVFWSKMLKSYWLGNVKMKKQG